MLLQRMQRSRLATFTHNFRERCNGDQLGPWLSGEAGASILKPAPNDYLQRWPVSKRVNSSKADADDATLIEPVDLVVA
jgi:hypothetical protein